MREAEEMLLIMSIYLADRGGLTLVPLRVYLPPIKLTFINTYETALSLRHAFDLGKAAKQNA